MERKIMLLSGLLFFLIRSADAQLSISQTSLAYTIDFDQSVNGINNATLVSSAGLPLMGSPANTGQLEASAWEIIPDAAIATAPSTFISNVNAGFNTLISPGQAAYGWGTWNLNNNHALAVLPASNAATPGRITLRIQNNTGLILTTLAIAYKVGSYNDKSRANSAGFYHSLDNLNYIEEPQLLYTSPGTACNSWDTTEKTLGLTGLNWQDGTYFYLRWYFQDASGSGLRDEFLLDNISLMGSSLFSNIPAGLNFISINNGLPPSATEDFSLLIQVVDSNGNPAAVQSATTINLSKITGTGLLTGYLTDTLATGLHTLLFQHLRYSQAETGLAINGEATGLIGDTTWPIQVLTKATYLVFTNFTDTIMLDENIPVFSIQARRANHTDDPNYQGIITLAKYSGPGNLLGSMTQSTQNGRASFSDIHFDQAGNYMLRASSDSLPQVLIGIIVMLPPPGMDELVVPQYFGSRSGAAVNNCRTPFAVCLEFRHQLPSTLFNLQIGMALTSEPTSSFGAGNIWNGTVFTTSANAVTGFFSTDASGNSGPVWIFLQPTGNSVRFEAGTLHQLRVGICPDGTPMPSQPAYIGNNNMMALDIPNNPRTTSIDDDGAFLIGKTDTSLSGKYCLIYGNTEGSGMPLYCSQIRNGTSTSTAQSELPPAVDSIWRQLPSGSKGNIAAIIHAGTTSGIRRVEARDENNMMIGCQTDIDGIWPGGANTTSLSRRQVIILDGEDIPLINVVKGTINYANSQHSPLDSTIVTLADSLGNIVLQTTTDSFGRYRISGMNSGNYLLKASCSKHWGGGNATDAQSIVKHFIKFAELQDIFKLAAQVSEPVGEIINSIDALWVMKRYAGLTNIFPANDWVFESLELTVTGLGIIVQDIKGLCRGDVNGDYSPW